MAFYEKKNGEYVRVSGGGGGSGLTDAEKALLITILRNAVYSNNQSANITALEALFNVSGGTEPDVPVGPDIPDEPDEPDAPVVTLTGITATYSGGDVAVGTAVTALTGIVVTAHYSDGSTQTVTGYTLSGTIVEGENTITVTYEGMTATFTVRGVAESGGDIHDGYISDGLEFRLDGIRNTVSGHSTENYKAWDDVSGNGYTTTSPGSANGQILSKCYTSIMANGTRARCMRSVTNATDLLSKLANYTVEVVWKGDAEKNYSSTCPIARFNNSTSGWFIASNGQAAVKGGNKLYGSAVTYDENIKHFTVTYDGTNLVLYHEGTQDMSMVASIDVTTDAKLEFFGDSEWAQIAQGYFYAARIYTRALSAEEVKANYDNDITRFGTVNVEVA